MPRREAARVPLPAGGNAETEIGDDGFFFVRVDFPAHVEDLCATLSA